jgi:hypothetical protein
VFLKDDVDAKKYSHHCLLCPGSKVLDYCHQRIPIPNPTIILPLIQKAVELCADVKDAKSGDVFFSKATWKVHVNVFQHIKLGCVSNIPSVNYCY